MKTVYKIAWGLLHDWRLNLSTDKIAEITGFNVGFIEDLQTKKKISDFLKTYKDNFDLVREIIEEIEQGKSHYPVEGGDDDRYCTHGKAERNAAAL
jgi:hypothetical protein